MSTRTVLLDVSGYHIKIVGDGDVGSSSAASVVFRTKFDETWDGMGIIAKFTDAAAQTVTEATITEPTCTLNADGSWDIPMPHEATAYDGNALLSFVGVLIDEDAWIADTKKTEGSGITGVAFTEGGKDTFAEAVGEVGVYEFSYSSGWLLNGESVTLSEYGLSVTGTASDGDKFIVDLRHPILKKQTTKPLSFRVYASETERNGDNTEPITADDRDQMLAAAQLAKDWAGGEDGEQPSDTNNAKYFAGLASESAEYAEAAATSATNQAALAQTARQQAVTARNEAREAATDAQTAQGAAETAQSAAETAQGAAEQAASAASASATTASTAAVSAGNQAGQAQTARNQAVEARNDARDARDEAQAAQSAAETAQAGAETAQGKAETAQTAAEAAQSAAETAQGKSEDAQSAAETAQGKAETAQAAAEAAAAAAEAHKYDAFATEGVSSATRFRTTLGADSIPTKTALITQTAGNVPMNWTLRRQGKNQFDAATVLWKKGYNISTNGTEAVNSAYAYTLPLIPVIPGARYVASGFRDRATNTPLLAGTYCTMCYYDSTGTFRARYGLYGANENPYFTAPSIANGDDYDCCFVRMYCNTGLISAVTNKLANVVAISNVQYEVKIQFEIVDDPSATAAAATAYEPFAGVDYAVPITALNTPTAPTDTVTTALGQNVFSLIHASLPAVGSSFSATAEMNLRARLDPTLVYNQLKAAIVAAGS